MPTKEKNREKITIFRDYEANVNKLESEAKRQGISKSAYIRRSLLDSFNKEDRQLINLNTNLRKALNELSMDGIHAEGWALAYINKDAEASKQVTRQYIREFYDKGLRNPMLQATRISLQKRAERLGQTIKDEIGVSVRMLLTAMMKQEINEYKQKQQLISDVKKKVGRSGI